MREEKRGAQEYLYIGNIWQIKRHNLHVTQSDLAQYHHIVTFLDRSQDSTLVKKKQLIHHRNSCGISCRSYLPHLSSAAGATGKYYCNMKVLTCQCCDGSCGPDSGCNCPPCQQLDREEEALLAAEDWEPKPSQPLIDSWTWGQQPGKGQPQTA